MLISRISTQSNKKDKEQKAFSTDSAMVWNEQRKSKVILELSRFRSPSKGEGEWERQNCQAGKGMRQPEAQGWKDVDANLLHSLPSPQDLCSRVTSAPGFSRSPQNSQGKIPAPPFLSKDSPEE